MQVLLRVLKISIRVHQTILICVCVCIYIQSVPGGKVNIPVGHTIGQSKQKSVYVHVSYSEQFPR
jgi:hypothetical protein